MGGPVIGLIGTGTARWFDEDSLPEPACPHRLRRRPRRLGHARPGGELGARGLGRGEPDWRHAGPADGAAAQLGPLLPAPGRRLRPAGLGGELAQRLGRPVVAQQAKGQLDIRAQALGAIDPGFELNDLGFQIWADLINAHVMGGYRWTRPSRLFQSARLNLATFRSWDFGGDLTSTGYFLTGGFDLRNFSRWEWYVEYDPPQPQSPPHPGRAPDPEPAGGGLGHDVHLGRTPAVDLRHCAAR